MHIVNKADVNWWNWWHLVLDCWQEMDCVKASVNVTRQGDFDIPLLIRGLAISCWSENSEKRQLIRLTLSIDNIDVSLLIPSYSPHRDPLQQDSTTPSFKGASDKLLSRNQWFHHSGLIFYLPCWDVISHKSSQKWSFSNQTHYAFYVKCKEAFSYKTSSGKITYS